jgi:hypothetical protein
MGILEFLRLRAVRCPRCRSTRCAPHTRIEKQYVAAEHQAYESTAGWVYGHREILVSFRHCLDCHGDFEERRRVVKKQKARGATRAKKFGGYGTE